MSGSSVDFIVTDSVVAGLSLDNLRVAQFSILSAASHVWHRCLQPFQQFPHRLVMLCDPHEEVEAKRGLVEEWFECRSCCLDRGYSQRLRSYMQARVRSTM